MIKAVLFDLDETLLNQQDASSAALRAFHSQVCPGVPWSQVEERWNNCLKNHFVRYEKGEIGFQEQRRCRVRDVLDEQGIPDGQADRLFAIYLKAYEGNYRLFPEARAVLDQVGGYPLGVITNGDAHQQLDKLERTGIRPLFATVLISDAVGLRKPDTRIFELAARNLGVRPEECLFVGDNLKADYHGSINAGMQAILVNRRGEEYGNGIRQIASLSELVRYIF